MRKFLMGSFAVVLMGAAPLAYAHHTGHESRTPAECEKLPGTAEKGERANCLKCVGRPKPHHYHPDDVKGDRCNPDDKEKH